MIKPKFKNVLLKCKTIGILVYATNYDIIIGTWELYGFESPTQAPAFYLDICQNYVGGNAGVECAKHCTLDLYTLIMRLHTIVVDHMMGRTF